MFLPSRVVALRPDVCLQVVSFMIYLTSLSDGFNDMAAIFSSMYVAMLFLLTRARLYTEVQTSRAATRAGYQCGRGMAYHIRSYVAYSSSKREPIHQHGWATTRSCMQKLCLCTTAVACPRPRFYRLGCCVVFGLKAAVRMPLFVPGNRCSLFSPPVLP